MYEVIVVGGGPAGLSAALTLGNLRRSVLVLDAGEQRNLPSHAVHNYLGLEGISPRELLERGRAEARQAGAELRSGRVLDVRRGEDGFRVAVEGQPDLAASRIILATSLVDVMPDVDNLLPFYGTSVFHCPICDAATFADRPVVVISWGKNAASFTFELRHWTRDLTLVTHGQPIDAGERARLERQGVQVRTDRVARLEGENGRVSAVVLADGSAVRCDGVFFNVAHRPRNELALGLGCEVTPEGYVKINERYQTTVPNAYAAGDITTREEAVADAVAEGLIAATNIHLSLYAEL